MKKFLIDHVGHLAGSLVSLCTLVTLIDPKVLPPSDTLWVAVAGLIAAVGKIGHGLGTGTIEAAVEAAVKAATTAVQGIQGSGVAKALIVAVACGLTLGGVSGCATTGGLTPQAQSAVVVAADAAVSVAVSKGVPAALIQDAAKALKALDTGSIATLPQVTAVLAPYLVKLDPGQKAAANALLVALDQVIQSQQAANVQTTIQEVLDDVVAACALYTGTTGMGYRLPALARIDLP